MEVKKVHVYLLRIASESDIYLKVITLFIFSVIIIAINHCYCYHNWNILLMQVNNANILKPIGMLYNVVSS